MENYNQGQQNTGYPNAGYPNAGNPNAGYPNAGNPNAGYQNAGNPNAGYYGYSAGGTTPPPTEPKKKSKTPLIIGIVAGVLVVAAIVVAAILLFGGGKADVAATAKTFAQQLEEKFTTGTFASAKLLEKYEDEVTFNGTLEVVELPAAMVGYDSSVLTAVEGSKLEISFDRSVNDKKMDIEAALNVANLVNVEAELYADEDVVQIKVPMLSNDTFELENDNILGQIASAIPSADIMMDGGEIKFESLDMDTYINDFLKKYENRLEKVNSKIEIEKEEKVERDAFGKEDVECNTFVVKLPAEVINEYYSCMIDYMSLSEAIGYDDELTSEDLELTVYAAKKGMFSPYCIVGIEIEEVELSFEGKDNIFDDVKLKVNNMTVLKYKSEKDGNVSEDTLTIGAGSSKVELKIKYDSKSGEFSMGTDIASMVSFKYEYVVREEKDKVYFDDVMFLIEAEGEKLLIEGSLEYSGYESPSKISSSPKDFNYNNLNEAFGSVGF